MEMVNYFLARDVCLHLGEQWLLLLAWLMSSGCRYRILGNQFFFVVVLNLVCKSLAIEIYETQYLCHLRSKNKLMKLPPRHLTHALSFDFVEFSLTKLFNIQYLLHHRSKHFKTISVYPYSSRAFQWHQECSWGHCGVRYFNVTNKTNKVAWYMDLAKEFRVAAKSCKYGYTLLWISDYVVKWIEAHDLVRWMQDVSACDLSNKIALLCWCISPCTIFLCIIESGAFGKNNVKSCIYS